jgi:hypothetical protein
MRRGVVFGVAIVSLAVACGFPDVSYGPGDADTNADGDVAAESGSGSGSGDGSASDSGSGADVASATDAEGGTAGDTGSGSGGEASADTGSVDTGVADTGLLDTGAMDTGAVDTGVADTGVVDTGAADAPPDAPPSCDVDGDGYRATGALCNGNDCCDTDKSAHPGQTAYFPSADACGSFDYNCVNGEEPEYPTSITCTGTGLTGCHGGPGFIGAPACGQSGPWGTCQGSGALACQAVATMNIPQSCR